MKQQYILGGWYGDALPGGAYAVLMADHIQTHLGRVALPNAQQVLYLRCCVQPEDGVFMMAGQGHEDGAAWEYWGDSRRWASVDDVCIGTSPVIYDAQGDLVVSHGGEVGSQGYRYLDPVTQTPVTGDATYGPRPGIALYEWTDLGDGYYVGQGNASGCWLRGPDLKYRQVVTGVCRWIRATRTGHDVAIATCRSQAPHEAILTWATLDELLALPSVDQPPTEVLTEPIAPPPASPFPCWVGAEGCPEDGNMAWSDLPEETRPVLESLASGMWTVRKNALLCGYQETRAEGIRYLDAEIQAVKARPDGAAIYLHLDDGNHVQTWLDAGLLVRANGLVPIFGIHACLANEETAEACMARIMAPIPADATWGIVRSSKATWSRVEFIKLQALVTMARQASPRCLVDVVFGWLRSDSQILTWPELVNYYHTLWAGTTTPLRWVRPNEAPTPIPNPGTIIPKPGKGKDWVAIAGGLGAGIFWLVKWFRRKKG